MVYIKGMDKDVDCIFCDRPKRGIQFESLVVHIEKDAFVILNRYPYNSGHVMVVPTRHVNHPSKLSREERGALMDLLNRTCEVVGAVYRPQGLNVGMNIGRVAGAGIDEHIHFHIVPRWGGDTNFMPVIGQTKIISEALEESFDLLKQGFADLIGKSQ
jgi:ATP adenylyltransferase